MLNRTKSPEAYSISMPVIPAVQEIRLSNNVDCVILNQGTQPVVLLELVFPIGRLTEPAPGIAYYAAKMLTEGTSSRSSEQIASVFDFYGSHLEITPTLDSVNVKLYTLTRFFPELARVLLELIRESVYPEKEFSVVKRIRIQQILQQHAKNNAFAGLKFREALFGTNHPYGEIIDEEKAKSITLEEVRAFAGSFNVKPIIFMAGQVGDEEVSVLAETFGKVPFDLNLERQTSELQKGISEEITREDSTQASIRMGDHTITRAHQDIHKLKITNTLFGGFFGSRLMKNIREEKGLTYGINSSIIHLQEASYWQIGTEVLRDKLDLAREEIEKEIKNLQNNSPSKEELDTVVSYMKGKLLTTFDTPFNAINALKNAKLAGRGPEFFEEYQQALRSVTSEEVSAMAKKYFSMNDAVAVVVK